MAMVIDKMTDNKGNSKKAGMEIRCDCDSVIIEFSKPPIVSLYCHCQDCRDLTKAAFYSGVAFETTQMSITRGEDCINKYEFKKHQLKRHFCRNCGNFLYAINRLGLITTSAYNFSDKSNDNINPNCHLFYGERVIDMSDNLIKYDKGTDPHIDQ